jgi:hypothetical protein
MTCYSMLQINHIYIRIVKVGVPLGGRKSPRPHFGFVCSHPDIYAAADNLQIVYGMNGTTLLIFDDLDVKCFVLFNRVIVAIKYGCTHRTSDRSMGRKPWSRCPCSDSG